MRCTCILSPDRHSNRTGIPALPFCKITLKAQKPLSNAYPQTLKTLGDHLRKRRLDLKLLQKEIAQRLGTDEASVYNWENNRTSPSLHFIPKVIEFLGYVPYDTQARTFGEGITIFRRIHGITQEELAECLNVDPTTLGRWERNKGRPTKRYVKKLTVFFASSSWCGKG